MGNGYAAKLGGSTASLGPWKTLKVSKGDRISSEVYAYIKEASNEGEGREFGLFLGTLARSSQSSGETTHVENIRTLQIGLRFTPPNPSSQSSGLPNAYLRYVLYDETGTKALRSGRVFVTMAAKTHWERLHFDYEVPANGVLQIYITNETEDEPVYFDDMVVEHTPQLIVQENHYYPFGMNLRGIEKVGKPEHRYLYNGKEKQEEFGLNWIDYGARFYDAQLGRWHGVDELSEKYHATSPYAYVVNNPLKFIDPNGKEIEKGSQKEWDKQKKKIASRRSELQKKIENLKAKAEKKGWSKKKLARKIGNRQERISRLSSTLTTMDGLESSKQTYALEKTTDELGETKLDPNTKNIVIKFGVTSNFVHEVTHAGHFEKGEVGFSAKTGKPVLHDVFDEADAYQAQFAYSPSSVSQLSSIHTANSFKKITASWVQGITTSNNKQPYKPGGSANTAGVRLSINSKRDDLIKALPRYKDMLMKYPANTNILFFLKGTYYKK
ncbi:RHS repeat-associated core domain-containing protein [Microscilla marina]|nr:RHS repeat-associated core domain-containing protein [Microscilla marina]